ncbi:hypothetical protein [Mesorhizobium sp.]|uniref:hypothetical protein n=1 Tax=Mesorhizobium sp. TaxID=1871066 RepID=UPI001201089C|nr:hypothetical protein [Mesorhizobium sp.]TIS90599.1 MAG: hypothetical protein E5W89_12035 [Mesorhizobium sp.]
MSIETILASIPRMSPAKRSELRTNALAQLNDSAKGADARRVLEALDARIAAESDELTKHIAAVSIAKRVVEAFAHIPMTGKERNVVQALLDNPGETSKGLSRAMGWGGQIWHEKFGTMCKKRETRLWPAEPAIVRDANFYCGILAALSADNRWSIKPEVAEGFALLGLRPAKTT